MNKGLEPSNIVSEIMGNQSLVKVISETMSPERFAEAASHLLQNPAIRECTPESVLGCLLKAAIFGFRLSPELGQCWVVPRSLAMKDANGKTVVDAQGKTVWKRVATFQVGYKGWQELAFRSGKVESFDAEVVRAGDLFDYQKGSSPFLKYKAGNGSGAVTHVWAAATMTSGRVVFTVVDAEKIERHRRMSDSQKQGGNISNTPVGIWNAHFDAMAKRIPIRELCTTQLPKSELIIRAIEVDGGVTEITAHEVVETTPKLVEESAQIVELHEDYISEIKACKTKEALKVLYHDKKDRIDPAVLPAYYQEIVKHSETLTK